MLNKPIASEFITTACIDFFVVAITPITTTLVVIAMTFFIVLSLFSCSASKWAWAESLAKGAQRHSLRCRECPRWNSVHSSADGSHEEKRVH